MRAVKGVDRKDFIKKSIAGAAGVAFAGTARASLQSVQPAVQQPERNTISRTLGNTGLELPIVSMGVMNSDNPALIAAALDNGIIHLDTAASYMSGRNEEIIGGVLKGRPRDSYVIATKVRIRGGGTAAQDEAAFTEAFNASLQRLGLDYVDIFYHHNVSNRSAVLSEPIMEAQRKAKEAGKTRFLGISTHNAVETIPAAIDSKLYEVVLTRYSFRESNLEGLKQAIAQGAQAGLGIVAMKTIAGSSRGGGAVPHAAAALKWVLQDTNVTTAIPGFTSFDQLETDLSVMEDLNMTEQEREQLGLQGSIPGLYCTECKTCVGQCPQGLPIPDLMRAYMYTYGYRNLGEAHDLLHSLDIASNPCRDCSSCSVKCAQGFAVADRITDVVRLRGVPRSFFA